METYKRIKTMFKTEAEALDNICDKKGVKPDQLEADHTDELWQWNLKEGEVPNPVAKNGVLQLAIEDYESEALAVHMAKEVLKTFEGNLHRAHTETHYVFSKVRE